MSRAFNLAMTGNAAISTLPAPPTPVVGAFLSVGSLDLGNPVLAYTAVPGGGFVPVGGTTLTGPLYLWGQPPGNPNEAAPKSYVDLMLPLAGGTMTGQINLVADPQQPLQPATKQYADLRVLRAGDALTGPLTVVGGDTFTTLSRQSAPNLSFAWLDLPGNIAGAVATDGSLWFGQANFNTATLQNATILSGTAVLSSLTATTASVSGTLTVQNFTASGTVSLGVGSSLVLTALSVANDLWQAFDPRIPGFAYGFVDATGDLAGGITSDGTLSWSSARFNAVTTPSASITNLSLGGPLTAPSMTLGTDFLGPPIDARIPGLAFSLQDTAGNIAAFLDTSGVFHATVQGGNSLPLSGGTMTGPLILAADPLVPLEASTKSYVDTHAVPVVGGVMTGLLVLSGLPINSNHAASKSYVDTAVLNGPSGGGVGTDPTFNSVNVSGDSYLIGGKTAIRMWTPTPGDGGVPGIDQVFIGRGINAAGVGNTLVGALVGGSQITGGGQMIANENTYVGMQVAARHSGSNSQNVAVGCGALRWDTNPLGCVIVGSDCARNSTNNIRATVIGFNGQRNGNNNTDVVFVGANICYGNDLTTSLPVVSNTVAVGSFVLNDPNLSAMTNAVIIGTRAGQKIQSGSGHLILGNGVGGVNLISGTGDIYIGASGAIDAATAGESNTFRLGNHTTNLMRATGINTATPAFFLDWFAASTSYASDAAAAAGGVAVNQIYRNGSAVQCRIS